MRIRMYNVGYGDCFCLKDRKKSLLVDFGTNNSRIEGRPRKETFDRIISDLTTIDRKSLLLTHFHLDHLSGLLYMMRNHKSACEFASLYLPDVFSGEGQNHMLSLMMLADTMKDSALPSRQISLFALVEALIKMPIPVKLLRRGVAFEEKYQTLWPDTGLVQGEAEEIYRILEENHEPVLKELNQFAETLRQVIADMASGKQEKKDFPAVSVLEKEFRVLRNKQEFRDLLQEAYEKKLPLSSLRNKISIVFQNKQDGELNMLFTGDVESRYLQMIADNYDGQIPLFEHYWCIKVPHHGTQEHYFDFSPYMPENMLISNGIHFSNSKKQSKELRTSSQYGGLFYINDAHMYCTNSDCCDAYRNGCTCKEWDVISPAYYKDI
ncbi:MAG: hypothetical protein Q4B26_08330 [Eubacteriales bacterium]|nr:hypothetical protein [Eubacteriales bacterium]